MIVAVWPSRWEHPWWSERIDRRKLTRSFILDRGTAKLCVEGSKQVGSVVDIVGLVHGLEVHLQHRVATQ